MKKIDKEQAKLIDGLERHKANPRTFEIPDEKTRKSMPIGASAKIGMKWDAQPGALFDAERFWVVIKSIETKDGIPKYTGAVDNKLFVLNIEVGELVEFEPKHILGVLPAPTRQ